MKKILFIGGGGFIGSNLVRQFKENKHHELYVIEPVGANTERLDNVGNTVKIIRTELKDFNAIEKIILECKIEIVFHLASLLLPSSNFAEYKTEMSAVVLPSMKIMQICSKHKAVFVYFSSGGAVYGHGSMNPHKEDEPLEPISFYGHAKYQMEQNILFEHRRSEMRYLILRPSNPFGVGQNIFSKQGLIAVTIGSILKSKPITIWGDGSIVRDYIYITDLCEYVFRLVNANVVNEIINIGSGKGYSITDILKILEDIVGHALVVKYVKGRKVDVNSVILNIDRLGGLIQTKTQSDIYNSIARFYYIEVEKMRLTEN